MFKTTKRTLAVLLAVLMLTLSMPFAVFAEGEVAKIGDTTYETLEAAISAASDSDTIILLKNIDTNVEIPKGKTLTLNLNGKNITCANGNHAVNVLGTLTVVGEGLIKSTRNCGICVSGGTLNFNGGSVEAQEMAILAIDAGTVNIDVPETSVFTAIDNAVLGTNGTKDRGKNTITINGGTYNGTITTEGYVACGIYAPNDDTWTVNNATFNITNGAGVVQRAGTVTITNTTINTTGNTTGKVGDSRIGVQCAAFVFDSQAKYPGLTDEAKTMIQSGSFASEVDTIQVVKADSDTAQRFSVSGGTFSGEIPAAYLANGVETATLDDGVHVLTPVAEKPATETEHGNIAYYTDGNGNCFTRGEDDQFVGIDPEKTVLHNPGDPVRENEVAATCQAEGSYDEVVYCTVCEEEISRESKTIAKIAHTFKNGVDFYEENNVWYAIGTCSIHPRTTVEEKAEWKTKAAATCTEAETGWYVATINGQEYKSEEMTTGEALDHNYQFEKFIWSTDSTTASAKLVCSRCGAEKLETATVTPAPTEATCTEDAYTEYTATYGTAAPESKTVTAANTKLGHTYDNGNAEYNNDNATHRKICDRCNQPSDPVACFSNPEAGWSGNTATCTASGKEFRTCPVCGHEYERATKALGHQYGSISHDQNGNDVIAHTYCFRCNNSISETKQIYTVDDPATCTTPGTRYYRVNFDNSDFNDEDKDYYTVKTETIPVDANAHAYEFKGFVWNKDADGNVTATAKFVCKNDATHTTTASATVTKDEAASVAATCAAKGKDVYNATVTFEENTYATGTGENDPQPYTVELDKIPHVYGETPYWTWTDDTHATATFTCPNCEAKDAEGNDVAGHTVKVTATVTTSTEEGDTTPATCTENGSHKNIATVTFEEKEYTAEKTVTDPATGHTYAPDGKNAWEWTKTEDGYTAKVKVVCSVCKEGTGGHTDTLNATVSGPNTVDPGHATNGSKTYTATANYREQVFTDTHDDEIPTEDPHVWDYESEKVTYTWEGFTKCTATVPCKNCNATTTVETTSITDKTTTGSCVERRVKTYTAVFEKENLSAETTETLDFGAHNYGELIPGEEATCTSTGKVAHYHCDVCDKNFDADKKELTTIVVDALGHDFTGEYNNPAEGKHNRKCTRCDEFGLNGVVNATESCTGGTASCSKQAVCEVCGAAYGDTLPHTPVLKVKENKDDTYPNLYHCYNYLECTTCGAELDRSMEYTVVDPDPCEHVYHIDTIITEATCAKEGECIMVCEKCGDKIHDTLSATGNHVDADNSGKCDTCNTKMTGGSHCKYCGKIHGGAFGWLTKFFHSILAIFVR